MCVVLKNTTIYDCFKLATFDFGVSKGDNETASKQPGFLTKQIHL